MDDRRLTELGTRVRILEAQLLNMVSRGTLLETDDTGPSQQQAAFGQYREQIPDMKAWLPFGLSSVAPPGSDTLILSIGGNRDGAMAILAGHPDYRPSGSQIGETVLYDIAGQTVKLGADGIVITDASGSQVTMKGGTVTIKATDIAFESSSLSHNGKNIGDTHTHTDTAGVTAGVTSPPN